MELEDHVEYMDSAGKWGKYQCIVSAIVIMTSMYIPVTVLTLPMMQRVPNFRYINATDNTVQEVNPQKFCSEEYYSEPLEDLQEHLIVDTSFNNWAAELKIVCHTKKIFSLVGTIYFIASIAAYLALSKFPDRYGRKTVFLYLNFFAFLSLLQLFYLVNYAQILLVSFVLGLSSLNLAISSVIVNETIDNKYSALVMGIAMAMFPFGGMINVALMYFLAEWRYYVFFTLLLLVATNYLGFKYLRESPKWLIANHKHQEYFETILYIARMNGNYTRTKELILKKQPILKRKTTGLSIDLDNINPEVHLFKEEYRKHVYSVSDLFTFRSISVLTVCNLALWTTSGFSFYGVLLNLEGLTGNIYVDSIVSYSAEFIAEIASGVVADRFGRKPTLFWSFLLAAVGCGLFPVSSLVVSLPLLFIACIGIASAFNVLYIYSAELYPTNIKSLAVSVFFVLNRLAGGTVPVILNFVRNVIPIIFVMSTVCTFIMCILPESRSLKIGDEVEEVKDKIYEVDGVRKTEDFVSFNALFDESY